MSPLPSLSDWPEKKEGGILLRSIKINWDVVGIGVLYLFKYGVFMYFMAYGYVLSANAIRETENGDAHTLGYIMFAFLTVVLWETIRNHVLDGFAQMRAGNKKDCPDHGPKTDGT